MSEIRHIPYNSTYLNKQMALSVYLLMNINMAVNFRYYIFCMGEMEMSPLSSS